MNEALHDITEDIPSRREAWRANRRAMEHAPKGRRWRGRVRHGLYGMAARASRVLGPTRMVRRVSARALDLDITELRLSFPDLPHAFDGYTILHLTDLHLDNIDGTAAATARRIAHVGADLCVVTGDFRDNIHTSAATVAAHFEELLQGVRVKEGVLGILGNHDSESMVEPLESLGVRMLLNETVSLRRGDDRIHITGLDDVHRFHHHQATHALRDAPDGFGIALVHSPEIVEHAAAKHRLYLCGHTHGGQICLPGGRPVAVGLKRRHRRFSQGLWQHGEMLGYTSRGIGACVLPFRVNSRSEVVRITLRRSPYAVMD